jgi:hypothetical protein
VKVEVFSCRFCGEEIALLIWLGDNENILRAQEVGALVDLPTVACKADRYFVVYPDLHEISENSVDDYLCDYYFKHKCTKVGATQC